MLASLNHPSIAHVYGIEDAAIVMERSKAGISRSRGRGIGPITVIVNWQCALKE